MRLVALVLLTSLAAVAHAEQTDPVLDALVRDALAARPELREAELRARAETQRAPQVGALADPVVTLGIQNDGFGGIEIGVMETSFVQLMLSQELPWPGKRGLRRRVADLGAGAVAALVERVRLSTEAEVRRGYLELILTRDRLLLLDRLAALWQRSEDVARARYEVASAPQSDILRAQLERGRLTQRRYALAAEERLRVQELNRLRGRPLDEAIATTRTLRDFPEPVLAPAEAEVADAEGKSPELRAAGLAIRRGAAAIDLAEKDRYPDFGVSAGIMFRGELEPMWQANVSMNLPFLWGRGRRNAAISESRALADAEKHSAAAVAQILRLRVAERRNALAAAKDTLRLYRDGLLVQSNATVESTLAQYRVGRVTFASVLEAVAGYIGDEEVYLTTIADTQRIAIAAAEVSLDPVGGGGGGGLGGGGMPGAGAISAGAGGSPAASAGGGGGGGGSASSSSMGGGM
jgi:outer membrane protein TolC